jgi:hypothetical protein
LVRRHSRFGDCQAPQSQNLQLQKRERNSPSEVDFADSNHAAISNTLFRSSSHAQQT